MNIHMGKCPKCDGVVNNVHAEAVTIKTGPMGTGRAYNGVSYLCPLCRAVLSVSIDPLALKADTVKAIRRQS
jgi:uncharacterized protein with PIN domain